MSSLPSKNYANWINPTRIRGPGVRHVGAARYSENKTVVNGWVGQVACTAVKGFKS